MNVEKLIVEKRRDFIIRFTYLLILAVIGFFAAKYAIPLFAPFLLGLVIAIFVRFLAKKPAAHLKLPKKVVYGVTLLLFYFTGTALVLLLGARFVDLVMTFFTLLPKLYTTGIQPAFTNILANLTLTFPELREFALASYQSINQAILNFVERISNTAFASATGFAGTITNMILKLIFTVISSFLFTMDLDRMQGFLKNQLSYHSLQIYENILYTTSHTAFRFIRAYIIIISVTFAELSVSFSILGLNNPIILAFIIAIFDALPVVGTGTVMIPWIIYSFFLGDYTRALQLVIIYVIIFIVRQSLEPKVVGDQIGLHPILTIMGLYIGARLFGFSGLFLLPLTMVILIKLNDDKLIRVWK